MNYKLIHHTIKCSPDYANKWFFLRQTCYIGRLSDSSILLRIYGHLFCSKEAERTFNLMVNQHRKTLRPQDTASSEDFVTSMLAKTHIPVARFNTIDGLILLCASHCLPRLLKHHLSFIIPVASFFTILSADGRLTLYNKFKVSLSAQNSRSKSASISPPKYGRTHQYRERRQSCCLLKVMNSLLSFIDFLMTDGSSILPAIKIMGYVFPESTIDSDTGCDYFAAHSLCGPVSRPCHDS